MEINMQQLRLIPYEGAGNITPVLDVGSISNIGKYEPLAVRKFLETNTVFRSWLKKEGKKVNADSIMIYYACGHKDYNYVTFVGEPNASIYSPFSEMCGNGIRCLSLHIAMNEI